MLYPPQEIDAITTQPGSDQTASQPSLPPTDSLKPQSNSKSATSEEQKQQSTEFEYNTQYSLATGNSTVFKICIHFSIYSKTFILGSPLFTLTKLLHISPYVKDTLKVPKFHYFLIGKKFTRHFLAHI